MILSVDNLLPKLKIFVLGVKKEYEAHKLIAETAPGSSEHENNYRSTDEIDQDLSKIAESDE